MAFFLILVMLTTCAAVPQDLSGKMLTFPQQTNTARVQLTPSVRDFRAATVCLKSITDLSRNHGLFSLATPSHDNAFVIYWSPSQNALEVIVGNTDATFGAQDYTLNVWHSVCSTWDSASGLVQLWVDGKPSIRKYAGGPTISNPSIILGQEQDSHGGGFDSKQSFVGMLADVHLWDYVLTPCEIQRYMEDRSFTPGNALNWRALEFTATGRVLTEDRQMTCQVKSC